MEISSECPNCFISLWKWQLWYWWYQQRLQPQLIISYLIWKMNHSFWFHKWSEYTLEWKSKWKWTHAIYSFIFQIANRLENVDLYNFIPYSLIYVISPFRSEFLNSLNDSGITFKNYKFVLWSSFEFARLWEVGLFQTQFLFNSEWGGHDFF